MAAYIITLLVLLFTIPVGAATYECPGGVYTDHSGPGCRKMDLQPPATSKQPEAIQRDSSLFEQQRRHEENKSSNASQDPPQGQAIDTQDQTCTLYREYTTLVARKTTGLSPSEHARMAELAPMFGTMTPVCYGR